MDMIINKNLIDKYGLNDEIYYNYSLFELKIMYNISVHIIK